MPTRQLRDEPLPTAPPAASATSPSPDAPRAAPREPVLLGDVLLDTLAEIARRAPEQAGGAAPRLPAQRTRPHP
ncbi:hypothetical protein [Kitasatospora sp. NPDC097643]|uniref:hypothetical protein n=1 Tax=Kitasatospora sp. NPDC097643 TaxID=3157230 RepID=UPI00331C5B56